MAIYEELIRRVDEGETFHIDFEKRTAKVGKEWLIKADETYTTEDLFGKYWPDHDLYAILHMIRELYRGYKYSLPSERSDSKRRKYFKALSIEELTDEQLMVAQKRETAQARLEGLILCSILAEQLMWDEDVMDGKWFYQDKKDSDLIILKAWIENKNN